MSGGPVVTASMFRARCEVCPWTYRSTSERFALDSLHAHGRMLHPQRSDS